jgi:protein SCO1/2
MTATTTSPSDPGAAHEDTAPPRAPRRWLRRLGFVVAALVAVGAIVWFGLGQLRPHPYSGTVMQAPTAAPSMDGLIRSDGTPVDLADYRGDLLLVYFGYTSCPDVCPTTLAQVASARRQLGDDAEHVRLLLVSIDPDRDELDRLGDYVRSFDPTFEGATGEPDAVARVASQYGVFFAKGEDIEGGGYTMDHTSALMGIDGDGHLRIVWPSLIDVDRLVADLRELS